MESFLLPHGLLSLFILSFLAATILPLGSEWFLIVLLLKGFDPTQTVMIASIGNFIGAYTTYLIGLWGSDFLRKKVLRIQDSEVEKMTNLYEKYGIWSLLFSWLPLIGDPLCLVAGMLKVKWIKFSILVFSGKVIRYATLCYLVLKGSTT